MAISTIHISRIVPPCVDGALQRSRLIHRLENSETRRLTLILGQAAQGKTTLAASFARNSKTPIAWVGVEPEDSDPVNLFYVLAESLQYIYRDADLTSLFHYPSLNGDLGAAIARHRDWARAIFRFVKPPLHIILDGLDRLSEDAPSFRFLQALIEEVPPKTSLIMLSRHMPPLDVRVLEMQQEASIVTNEELAFTLEEAKAFWRRTVGPSFTAREVRKFHDLTEGWIGGLVLLRASMNRQSGVDNGGSAVAIIPERFRGEVFGYLSDVVFSAQQKRIQEILVRSSILNVLEPALLRALLGAEDVGDVLEGLASRNLFVQSTFDENRGWCFRYHQLFREFLKAKFDSWVSFDEREALFLKVASICETSGQREDAIAAYLQVKAFPQAAALVESLGMDLLRGGRKADLSRWILALPVDMVQERPWLRFYGSMTRRYLAERGLIQELKGVFDAFHQSGDLEGRILSLAYLIETSVTLGNHVMPLAVLLEDGERLLDLPESSGYPYEKAVLSLQVGFGHVVGGGDIRKGVRTCNRAYLIGRQLRDLALQANALVFSALGLVYVGEYARAKENCAKLERLLRSRSYPRLRVVHQIANIVLEIYLGDFLAAQELVKAIEEEIEQYDLFVFRPFCMMYRTMLGIYRQDFSGAFGDALRLANMAESTGNAFLEGVAHELRGLCHYHAAEHREARVHAEKAIGCFSGGGRSDLRLHRTREMLGLILLALGDTEEAEEYLEASLRHFSAIQSRASLAETHLALGLVRWKRGRFDDAIADLRAGFKIAAEWEYDHFITMSPGDLVLACLLTLELKLDVDADYAAHLLISRFSGTATPALRVLSKSRDPWVRSKAMEIRKTIHRATRPLVRIQCLGEFRVWCGDREIEDWSKQGRLPKQLLKALIARGSRRVSKDALMEDLWGEDLPAGADKRFKMVLYRLRRVLEPFMEQDVGSSYVHMQGGMLSLDERLCRVDVDRFLALLRQADNAERFGDLMAAMAFLEEARGLYSGEFFPEERYADWAEPVREKLKEKYLGLLMKVGDLHERGGAYKKAVKSYQEVARMDPLLEEAYQRLMSLHGVRGNRSAALKVYEECRRRLDAELDTEPDEVTEAIYRKIAGDRGQE
jgi:LuxR family transcriptional regulator, maltose regulon positive regulatory protein